MGREWLPQLTNQLFLWKEVIGLVGSKVQSNPAWSQHYATFMIFPISKLITRYNRIRYDL